MNINIMSRVIKPGNLEVHNIFYSSVYKKRDNLPQNARIGLMQIFHANENVPFPEFSTNNYLAFSFPEKNFRDEWSDNFSFDIRGERIIAKSNLDNYFEIGSFCQND